MCLVEGIQKGQGIQGLPACRLNPPSRHTCHVLHCLGAMGCPRDSHVDSVDNTWQHNDTQCDNMWKVETCWYVVVTFNLWLHMSQPTPSMNAVTFAARSSVPACTQHTRALGSNASRSPKAGPQQPPIKSLNHVNQFQSLLWIQVWMELCQPLLTFPPLTLKFCLSIYQKNQNVLSSEWPERASLCFCQTV